MDSRIHLSNGYWNAEAALHGGQLLQCRGKDSPFPVVWLGRKASFETGCSIRGGSPVCWPWFGASPVAGRPVQGFARLYDWEIVRQEKDFVRMTLPENWVPEFLRDFPFELYSEILLTDQVEISLIMKNCGREQIPVSAALHTYLAVSDCEKIVIHGLEEIPFSSKGSSERVRESVPIRLKGECCRLYEPHSGAVRVVDPEWNRIIHLEKENSCSSFIWNPGRERAAQIPDLAQDEYRRFVCVEANRAGSDVLLLPPGVEVKFRQKIRLIPLQNP